MATTSDERLLALYKAGDARAFRVLVQRYTTPIYNIALRLLGDPMEAENVAQETFLRVITSLGHIRLDIPFRPYLFRIAINLCRDVGRKRRPVLFTEMDAASAREEAGDGELASEAIADDAPPPSERLEREELYGRLHAALGNLSPTYQTVITLRYTEDFSYEEIAVTLDLPINTVRTQLRRAKQQLKLLLEKDTRPVRWHNGFGSLALDAEGGVDG